MSSSLKIPELTDQERRDVVAGRQWWNENFPGFIDLLTERVKEEIKSNFEGLKCLLDEEGKKGGRKTKRRKKRRKGKTRKVKRGGGKNTPWWVCIRKCVGAVVGASVILIVTGVAVGGPIYALQAFNVFEFEPNMAGMVESYRKQFWTCSSEEEMEELSYAVGPTIVAALACGWAALVGVGATAETGGVAAPWAYAFAGTACAKVSDSVYTYKQAEGRLVYKCERRMGFGWYALANIIFVVGAGTPTLYLLHTVLCSAKTFSSRQMKKMIGVWEIIYDQIWRYDRAYLGSGSVAMEAYDDDFFDRHELSGFTDKERDQLYAEIQTGIRQAQYNGDVRVVNKAIEISKGRVVAKNGLVSAVEAKDKMEQMRQVLVRYRDLQFGEVNERDIKKHRDDRNSGGSETKDSGGGSGSETKDKKVAAGKDTSDEENQAVASMKEKMKNGLLEPLVLAGMFQPVTDDMQRNVFYAIYAVGVEGLIEAVKLIEEEKRRTKHDEAKGCDILGRFFSALLKHSLKETVDSNRSAHQHRHDTNSAGVRLTTGLAQTLLPQLFPRSQTSQPPVVQNFVLDPRSPTRGPPAASTGGPTFQEVHEPEVVDPPAASNPPPPTSAGGPAIQVHEPEVVPYESIDELELGGGRLRKRKVRKTRRRKRRRKRRTRKN